MRQTDNSGTNDSCFGLRHKDFLYKNYICRIAAVAVPFALTIS